MGFPYGVDFCRGYPTIHERRNQHYRSVTPERSDVFMVIAADPGAHYPGGAVKHLAEIPVIQIDIHWGPSTEIADVVLPGSFIGVECGGTSYRMDRCTYLHEEGR